MRPVILVFAKAPVPGRVKTRLHTVLTPAEAARLHKAFVLDTLESLNHLAGDVEIELLSDIGTSEWPRQYRLQSTGSLGQRMLSALDEALSAGHPQALIVGSDSPTLPLDYLRDLLHSPADVALGPAEDGGYYAIACRRTDPRMFAGVEWSTKGVLQQTIEACERCGLSTAIGSPWWDVDTPEDLDRLRRENSIPAHTRDILTAWQFLR